MPKNHLTIFDTTLRDGEQAPGFSMRMDEKLKMARKLTALGVDVIEAGFPIASEADAEGVRMVASHIRGPVIAALARCNANDVERAAWALAPAPRKSPPRVSRDLGPASRTQAANDAPGVYRLRDRGGSSRRGVSRRCAVFCGRCDAQRSGVSVARLRSGDPGRRADDQLAGHGWLLDAGRDAIFFSNLIDRVPSSDQVTWSTHCHDDLGLAVANSLAAIEGGARQVECTINGIGERAGNASIEEVVMATRVRHDRLPYDTAINTSQLFPASQLLTTLTGEGVQANKAIVGRNAFAHEAGIHQDGMLKDRRTYEIMRPEDVGVPKATLVLGKHSGRHAVQRRCEQIGVTLDRRELDNVYRAVIAHADREKVVTDADLSTISPGGAATPEAPSPARSHPTAPILQISTRRQPKSATATGSSGSVRPKVRRSYSTVTLLARFRG